MTKKETTYESISEAQKETALAVRPESLKPVRKLTLDATSISRLKQVVCRCDGELEAIELPPVKSGEAKQQGVGVPITDVISGVQYLLICNSLIVSALQRAGAPLAGKYFAIRAGEIKAGKRYRLVDVIQLELQQ